MLLANGVRSQRVQTAAPYETRARSADRSTASSQQPLVHQEPRTQPSGDWIVGRGRWMTLSVGVDEVVEVTWTGLSWALNRDWKTEERRRVRGMAEAGAKELESSGIWVNQARLWRRRCGMPKTRVPPAVVELVPCPALVDDRETLPVAPMQRSMPMAVQTQTQVQIQALPMPTPPTVRTKRQVMMAAIRCHLDFADALSCSAPSSSDRKNEGEEDGEQTDQMDDAGEGTPPGAKA
ncbi:hypothetical protein CCMA1212_003417 [Trichoderma ghanense]|uniref:Uncharacterized protein n=1 Tax=Trichoderma ghanense TaxID=65468 RepID=A0ABY2H8T4_9HYPO